MGDVIQMNREDDLAKRIQRAEAIRAAIERKEPFPPGDQIQAARNLHRVLENAKAVQDFNVHNVLATKGVGLGGNGGTDSTKRLDTYTLPDGADDHRKARIAKKPQKFWELAKAIAAELDKPAAVLVSQVFEGCSVGTEELPEGDWDSENWSLFAEHLQLMAVGIIRDHDVEGYWRKTFSTNGWYDVRTETFCPASNVLSYIQFGYGLAGEWMVSDETSPTPSIPLGQRLQGDPIPGWVSLEEDQTIDVFFRLWLEVRLALGPVNDHRSIGPLLEFRTVLDAVMEDNRIMRFDNPFTEGSDMINRAFIDDDEFPVHGLDYSAESLMEGPNFRPIVEPEFRSGAEHSYFGWREVSPALLRSLLDEDNSQRQAAFIPVCRHEGVWVNDLPPSRFSRASAAGVLNIDLLTGALEAELGAECNRLAAGLDALRAEQDRAIRDAEAEAMARWTTKTATSPVIKRVDQ